MKKVIHFSKLYVPCVIFSILVIVAGLVVVGIKGINYGIDFKPGLVQEVRIVPPAIDVTYSGNASVSLSTSTSGVTAVISDAGADNATVNFYYGQYPTVADMVAGLNTLDGVSATALVSGSTPSDGMFTNSEVSAVLSKTPYSLYRSSEEFVEVEAVRSVLSSIDGIDVKGTGEGSEIAYQIRISAENDDSAAREAKKAEIISALGKTFGEKKIAVIKTDFVGANFSKSLTSSSVILVLATLALIWLYAMIRFKWDFAFGAVIAIIHDALIMVAFVAFVQMEFTTTTIAAILTIVGYSINDTVVILDRIRENIRLERFKNFKELLDNTLTETLSRTIITTVTTLLAVLSLYFFTTGTIKDFALALFVGMISGVYSTIFISSSFIAVCRKNWKPSDEIKQPTTLSSM